MLSNQGVKNVFETMFESGHFKSLFVYKKEKKASVKKVQGE